MASPLVVAAFEVETTCPLTQLQLGADCIHAKLSHPSPSSGERDILLHFQLFTPSPPSRERDEEA